MDTIEALLETQKHNLSDSFDVSSRVLEKNGTRVGFLYLRTFTDATLFAEDVFKPLSQSEKLSEEVAREILVKIGDVKEVQLDGVADAVLDGNVVLLFEKTELALAVDIASYPARIPSEPPTSPVIQGPREGFTEDYKTNITLLRRRFYTKDLVLKNLDIGEYTKTKIVIAYIKGVARNDVVKNIEKRLKDIKIDGIIDAYYLLSYLSERPDSLFKQVGSAEKPDIVAAKMLEGRVAIIVDGSPIVLTLPFMLIEDMQSSNDYYTNHHFSSFIRVIRLLGICVALLAPGMYLALQLYHYNIVPLNFLITIADTTEGLPFTPFFEMLFISLLFQILYEVSLRLPSYLGLATSIVGALILGDTGVKAGLISPPGVIVVALAKISLYTSPEQAAQITLLQFIFLILGGTMGLLGITGGLIYLLNYISGLESYGVPYMAPYGPRVKADLKDGVFKAQLQDMRLRPESLNSPDKVRIEEFSISKKKNAQTNTSNGEEEL